MEVYVMRAIEAPVTNASVMTGSTRWAALDLNASRSPVSTLSRRYDPGDMPGRRHQHVDPASGSRSDPELEIEQVH
jgi:hypothetical protein